MVIEGIQEAAYQESLKDQDGATLKQYATQSNVFAAHTLDQETQVDYSYTKGTFSLLDFPEYTKDLSNEDIDFLSTENVGSMEEAQALMFRRKRTQEAQEAMSHDSTFTKLGLSISTGLVDPTIAIPYAGLVAKFKTAAKLGPSIFKDVAIWGGIGVAEAVAHEGLFDLQGEETNYTSSMLWAGGLSMGMAGLSHAISSASNPNKVMKIITETDPVVADSMEKVTTAKVLNPKSPVPQLQHDTIPAKIRSILNPHWLKPSIQKAVESTDDLVRTLSWRLSSSVHALRDKAGVAIKRVRNAEDYGHSIDGAMSGFNRAMPVLFRSARKEGYKGKSADFYQEAGIEFRRMVDEQKRLIQEKISSEMTFTTVSNVAGQTKKVPNTLAPDAYKKRVNELAKEIQPKSSHSNPRIQEATDHIRKYFDTMRKHGQEVKSKGFKNLPEGMYYLPRVYDNAKITKLTTQELRDRVFTALRKANPNETDEVLGALAIKHAETLKSNTFHTYLQEDADVFKSEMKARKLNLNESDMGDIYINNIDDVTGMYHYKNRGRFKLKYGAGIESTKEIKELVDQMKAKSAKNGVLDSQVAKDYDALTEVLEDTLGTLRVPRNSNGFAWRATRLTTAWNALTLGGSFGINTVMELAGAMWATGFRSIFNGSMGQTVKDVKAVLYNGSKEASQLSDELISMGFLQDWLHTHQSVRYADTDPYFNLGKLEHKIMGMTEALFKYNGMKAITGMLEQYVASNAIHDIIRLGKKQRFTRKELDRLSGWGISKEEAKALGEQFSSIMKFDGKKLVGMNIGKMSKATQTKLHTIISRATRSGVLKNDTMQLPSWMLVPTPMRKLATQFMRFPMIAHNVLLMRGIEEDVGGLAATALAGTLMYGSYTYLREQAALATGLVESKDTKYDIFDGDGEQMLNLISKSVSYTAPLGVFSLGASLGKEFLGLGYSNSPGSLAVGPVASNVDAFADMFHSVWKGEDVGYKAAKLVQRNTPYFTVPMMQESLNLLAKEFK